VVVHGGGPQITAHLDRLGIASEFRGGLRVTTPEAMEVVRMVLVGQVNGDVVRLVNDHGPFAVGMSGEDGGLMTAEPRTLVVEGEEIDLGLVGDVTAVDPGALRALLDDGRIPVVATVAGGPGGLSYNVNADTAAAAIAVALQAQKLVVLTDVEGLYSSWSPDGEAGELVSEITAGDLAALLPQLSAEADIDLGISGDRAAELMAYARRRIPSSDRHTSEEAALEIASRVKVAREVVPKIDAWLAAHVP